MEDIATMRALPNMTIVCPTDGDEMRRFMEQTTEWPKPIYIRLGKGGDPITSRAEEGFTIGKAIVKRGPGRVLLATTGIMVYHVLGATKLLAERGIACGVVHFPTVKPLDATTLLDLASGVDAVVTVEEHTRIGGLGSAILEGLSDSGVFDKPVLRLGLPDRFTHNYGSQDGLIKHYGLNADGIAAAVAKFMAHPETEQRASLMSADRPMFKVRYSYLRSSSPTRAQSSRAAALRADRRLHPGQARRRVRAAFAEVIGTRHAIGCRSGPMRRCRSRHSTSATAMR